MTKPAKKPEKAKHVTMTVRIPLADKRAIERLAAREVRSVTSMLIILIRRATEGEAPDG